MLEVWTTGVHIIVSTHPYMGSFKIVFEPIDKGPVQVKVNGKMLAEMIDYGSAAIKEYPIEDGKVEIAVYSGFMMGFVMGFVPNEDPFLKLIITIPQV